MSRIWRSKDNLTIPIFPKIAQLTSLSHANSMGYSWYTVSVKAVYNHWTGEVERYREEIREILTTFSPNLGPASYVVK